VRQPESPPVAVVEKNISDFDMTADEFHGGSLLD
jgi:hypothetical protein